MNKIVRRPFLRALAGAVYPALVVTCWLTFGFVITGTALILAGATASATFIVLYRPFDLRAHGPAGKNLLVMTWSTFLLFFLSLIFDVVPLPMWLVEMLSLATIGGIVYAVVQRVVIWLSVRQEERDRLLAQDLANDPAHDLEDTGDPAPGS